MSERGAITEEALFELLSFLVTSAHLCVQEPRLYGTFRLIDAACRLLGFALEDGQLESEQFLRAFKEDADQRKFLLFSDETRYLEFLEDATRKMAKEMKNRALLSGA